MWLGEAKVSCILCHRGVQVILAYSYAKPAALAASKGRRGMFIFLLSFTFIHFPFSPVPLIYLLYSLFSLSLGDDKIIHKGLPFINQKTMSEVQYKPTVQLRICYVHTEHFAYFAIILGYLIRRTLYTHNIFSKVVLMIDF